jgi:hypothetical protein
LRLAVDPRHPGNHRLAASGVAVTAVTIDGLLEPRENRRISIVKIDVQGAEGRVLHGMKDTLARHRPVLLIELDRHALKAQGADVREIVREIAALGYVARIPARLGPGPMLSTEQVVARCAAHAYIDVLFLPHGDQV